MEKGDVLVVNETRVFQARLYGKKEKTQAKIEVFLLRELNKMRADGLIEYDVHSITIKDIKLIENA
jgi:S-adenosylmethionine:tRNA-ribosyltransferase-isomerase (queuine synthetase)